VVNYDEDEGEGMAVVDGIMRKDLGDVPSVRHGVAMSTALFNTFSTD